MNSLRRPKGNRGELEPTSTYLEDRLTLPSPKPGSQCAPGGGSLSGGPTIPPGGHCLAGRDRRSSVIPRNGTSDRDFIRQDILEHLVEGEELHPATSVMRVQDVLVTMDASTRLGPFRLSRREERRPILSGPFEEVEEAQLCTTHCGSIYFGDWIMVDIPIELLALQRGSNRSP